ncbi:aspartate/glutamate racemase family protein [Xanthobacter sp. VTT E-85241]|uniref:aspartate/glutamate racemase family protein n=1 Tax=Roseixanthobacter finlandensis TaxID=3119922 RepID=UPI0037297EE9
MTDAAANRILVINPNSNAAVTAEIAAAVRDLASPDGPAIQCVTLHDGPPGVETQGDVEHATRLVLDYVGREAASAYVIACYSDPGLIAARERTARPVLGIGEAGTFAAMMRGDRFGVIAILEASVRRQQRQARMLGVFPRYAGSKAIGLGVAELADHGRTRERMIAAGAFLRDAQQADVLILGCAGMARHRAALEDALGLPVIEPSRAATAMALAMARLAAE